MPISHAFDASESVLVHLSYGCGGRAVLGQSVSPILPRVEAGMGTGMFGVVRDVLGREGLGSKDSLLEHVSSIAGPPMAGSNGFAGCILPARFARVSPIVLSDVGEARPFFLYGLSLKRHKTPHNTKGQPVNRDQHLDKQTIVIPSPCSFHSVRCSFCSDFFVTPA